SAAIRLGMAFASPEIVGILTKIKYPYNINILTQQHVLSVLENHEQVRQRVADTLVQREWLHENLLKLSFVEKIYPSDANFLLVKVTDANTIYRTLIEKGIVVRNRSSVALCNNCLRITVGTPEENAILYQKLATCFEFLKK
ncbi:MAG TPA: aminotransferase class I/II-fold pyridoxal phosphate-dependent enzyme, partial [Paludibacteraceae bacterium]|nr:aminotransferase class I/II-fold pyridoxal phosphate-dependent enzyme [Paludibacteraceae bacterium]